MRQALLSALNSLTPHQRAIVALRYFDDRSDAEVPEALGVAIGTIKCTASRAVAQLPPQVRLDDLAVKATAQHDVGRYAVLAEDRAPIRKTTVFDSLTGDLRTYQQGGGAPPVIIEKHVSPTSAELAAKLPANLAALRAFLISDANSDDAKAEAIEAKLTAIKDPGARPPAITPRTDE